MTPFSFFFYSLWLDNCAVEVCIYIIGLYDEPGSCISFCPCAISIGLGPTSPQDELLKINVMLFHPLASKIWAGTDQNDTFFDNNWPPS